MMSGSPPEDGAADVAPLEFCVVTCTLGSTCLRYQPDGSEPTEHNGSGSRPWMPEQYNGSATALSLNEGACRDRSATELGDLPREGAPHPR